MGEAVYTNDINVPCLHAAFVISHQPNVKLISIDPRYLNQQLFNKLTFFCSEALAMDGVVSFVSAEDVPGNNTIGPCVQDEQVFFNSRVPAAGLILGLVVAKVIISNRGYW